MSLQLIKPGTTQIDLGPDTKIWLSASGDLILTQPDINGAPVESFIGGPATELLTTTGPTTLTIGAIADGQFLKRVGSTVVGAAGGGGGIAGTMVLNRVPYGFDAATLQTSANLTFDGSTLIVSNGAAAAAIAVFQDNGVMTATLPDGGGFELASTPGIPPSAAGGVKFRSNAGVFEVSENGGAYAAPGGGGIDGTMVLNRIPVGLDADTLQTYAGLTFDGSQLTLASGTVADGARAFSVTATLPAAPTTFAQAIHFTVTSAGSAAQSQRAVRVDMAAGYTGPSQTMGAIVVNSAAGAYADVYNPGNAGAYIAANGSGAVGNVGAWMYAEGAAYNVAALGRADVAHATNINVGGAFFGRNTGGGFQVGVLASLNNGALPQLGDSAALVADCADQTVPIARFRANGVGTDKWTILHSGNLVARDDSSANIAFGTVLGSMIGTTTLQKLAFHGSTPIVQPAGTTDVLASLVSLGLRGASSNPDFNIGSGVITASEIHATDGGTNGLTVRSGNGAPSGNGGGLFFYGSAGGDASGAAGGGGGGFTILGGPGGAADASFTGGLAGDFNIGGGKGGAGSAAFLARVGGSLNLQGGDAGDDGGFGGADGGPINIGGGFPSGAGIEGAVNITSATGTLGFYGVTAVVQAAAIADASGGAIIDAEARAALNALLAADRGIGVIAT